MYLVYIYSNLACVLFLPVSVWLGILWSCVTGFTCSLTKVLVLCKSRPAAQVMVNSFFFFFCIYVYSYICMCLVVRAVASYKSIQQSGLMTWLAAAVQGDGGLMVSQSIYIICMHVALSSRASSKPKGKIHTCWELLMTLNPYISELFINSIHIRLGFTPRMYIIVQGLNNMDGRGF